MGRLLIFMILILTVVGCNKKVSMNRVTSEEIELRQLQEMMSGTFSSAAQAEIDSNFFSINLVMYPIWESSTNSKWLYVEQAATSNLRKPYRQRIYRLSKSTTNIYESRVYQLPQPEKYIHGWENKYQFDKLSVDSLIIRQGCAVFLSKEKNGCYSGSTKGDECKSSLRGASYATSIVTICKDEISSWDQGWNETDNQVWGSEMGAYIFQKID